MRKGLAALLDFKENLVVDFITSNKVLPLFDLAKRRWNPCIPAA